MKEFRPTYTWPNPAFPFRLYFESDSLRLFIIENLTHNWDWLYHYRDRIQSRDMFFVYCGWFHSEWFADQAEAALNALKLEKSRFFYMFNSIEEMHIFSERGFTGEIINHNAWLDENLVMRPLGIEKYYNAIYVARRSSFKRHMLAECVDNLAIVAGNNHGNNISPIPAASFVNTKPLSPEEVCEMNNRSRCGLILSAEEGACFASSEYLLCGIPVVSTHSKGGRDIWYDNYNSIICEANSRDIADAVLYFRDNPRDPDIIRSNHISQAQKYRLRFIEAFNRLLGKHGVTGIDAYRYFYENFYHKMRKSIRPDFESIFPS